VKHKLVIISVIIIIVLSLGLYILYDHGFLPINGILPVVDPPNSEDPPEAGYCESMLDDLLVEIPGIENLQYELFTTETPIPEILSFYDDELIGMGYYLIGSGEVTVGDFQIHYAGYVEGLVGAGILITNELETPNNCVLFITGYAEDFYEIYEGLGGMF